MSLLSYTISGDAIKLDMTKERPVWILSSYAPGKDPPVQLIDKKDVSPEELRVRAYELAAQGNFQLFETEYAQLIAAAETQINNILNDTAGAVKFMEEAHKSKSAGQQTSAFGAATSPTTNTTSAFQPASAFATPSAFSQSPTTATASGAGAFGSGGGLTTISSSQPAFGQPSVTPAFGQVPVFGQPSLGQPSLAQPSLAAPAFGQTAFSQPAFGQPALGRPAFGQPAFGQPAFGQTLAKPAAPAFGQPAFGATSTGFAATNNQPTSAFTAVPAAPVTSAFGQPASLSNQLNRGAFSTPQGPSSTTNPFGTPAFGQPASASSPFTTSNTNNAFSTLQSAFQPSTAPTSSFATPHTSQAPVSAFAAAPAPLSNQNQNPFQTPRQPNQSIQMQQAPPQQSQQLNQAAPAGGKWDDPPITYSPEEVAAFSAPKFELGRIPLVPPSSQMCR